MKLLVASLFFAATGIVSAQPGVPSLAEPNRDPSLPHEDHLHVFASNYQDAYIAENGQPGLCCYNPNPLLSPYNANTAADHTFIDWSGRRRLDDLNIQNANNCDYCCNSQLQDNIVAQFGFTTCEQYDQFDGGNGKYLSCKRNNAAGCGGDPHFKTWHNQWFDFHGECDLVLLSVPDFANGIGLDIHVRTKIRYDYSYISSAAIKIQDDVLEVAGFGDYMVNGVSQAEMPNVLASMYPVEYAMVNDKQHIFNIQLTEFMTVTIKSFKDMVSVKFEGGDVRVFQNSVGLMGNRITGDMLARDGKTVIEDPVQFGMEWQVLNTEAKLFNHVDRFPQHPQQCVMPSPDAKENRRRLGETVSQEAAEKACAHWDDDHRDHCVFDVMATGDLEVAEANGAF